MPKQSYIYFCDFPSGSLADLNLRSLANRVYRKFHHLVEFRPEVFGNSEMMILNNTRLSTIMDLKFATRREFRGYNKISFFVHPVGDIKHIDMSDCVFEIKRMKL